MKALHERAKHAPRNTSGYPELSDDVVRQLVEAELGAAGAQRFDAVVRHGELPRPPGDAYGPCFDKRERHVLEDGRGFDVDEWFRRPGLPDDRCGHPAP